MTSPWYTFSSYTCLSNIFNQNISLTLPLSLQGLFALHRLWKKFDELQHEWHNKVEDLVSKNKLLEADAAFVKTAMEQNEKFKEEAETSKKAASEATKEVKRIKEELRTCQLDREYHKDVAEKKTDLVDTL